MSRVVASPARVLVVDDDVRVRDLAASSLRFEGFDVTAVGTADAASSAIDELGPDVVVLDPAVPGIHVGALQRRLAEQGSMARVLFLMRRDIVDDRVRGRTLGGDDSLTKPFSLEELLARIRAILRRQPIAVGAGRAGGAGGDAERSGSRFVLEDLVLDEDMFEVHRAGERIELTPTEFQLLRYLLRHPRRVLSKAQILDHVWAYDFAGDGNIVETYISYLRRKIDHGRAPLIQTVRGVGYSLRTRR